MARHIHLEMVRTLIGPVLVKRECVINGFAFGCSKSQYNATFGSECHAKVILMTEIKKKESK